MFKKKYKDQERIRELTDLSQNHLLSYNKKDVLPSLPISYINTIVFF